MSFIQFRLESLAEEIIRIYQYQFSDQPLNECQELHVCTVQQKSIKFEFDGGLEKLFQTGKYATRTQTRDIGQWVSHKSVVGVIIITLSAMPKVFLSLCIQKKMSVL